MLLDFQVSNLTDNLFLSTFYLLCNFDLTTVGLSETLRGAEEVANSGNSEGKEDSQLISAKVYENMRWAAGLPSSDGEEREIDREEEKMGGKETGGKEKTDGDAKVGARGENGKIDNNDRLMPDSVEPTRQSIIGMHSLPAGWRCGLDSNRKLALFDQDGNLARELPKDMSTRSPSPGSMSILANTQAADDQEGKIDENGGVDDDDEQVPDLEDDEQIPELEDGDANSDDCTSSDFPDSDCSFDDSDSDDEDFPEIHEMNHNDKWKLVQKNGRSTVYKNGIVVLYKPERCIPPKMEGEFIRHRLRLDRPVGLRGEVTFDIWHHGYVTRSMSEYTADFEKTRLLWEQSPEYATLEPFLEAMSVGKVQVSSIVLLCLGSLHTKSKKPWKCRKNSRVQLAVLLTVRSLLQSLNGGKKIECVAQDPDFSTLDKKFLKQKCDIEVVEDPQGFAAINENTLVFMMGGYSCIDYVMSRGPRPAALIMNTWMRRTRPSIKIHKREAKMGERDYIQRINAYEEDSIEDMLKGCEAQAFPNSDGYAWREAMSDAHLYWRRG